jgi:hypothetical protein
MGSPLRIGSRLNQSAPVMALNTPIPDLGGEYIGDTAQHPTTPPSEKGGYCAIYCVTATVLNAATQSNVSGLAGVTLPVGTWVYGIFSIIKLTSGSVIAYYVHD